MITVDELGGESNERELGVRPAPPRILVMDDDLELRNVLAVCLLELGYAVTCASNGEEAVRLFAGALCEGDPYSALILDLVVSSGMGGVEALAMMKRLDPDVAAIASSGALNSHVLLEYRTFGFVAALPKPWRFVELAVAVKGAVGLDEQARLFMD